MDNAVLLLLADDEPLILLSAQDALEAGGYSVAAANSGDQAIAILDEQISDIKGIVTDVRMGPGPDGWAVARYARELNPHLAVVYTTGDSAADWAANGVPRSVVVQKPYAPAQVLTAISSLLTQADTNSLS